MSIPARFKVVFFAPVKSTVSILDRVFTRFPNEAGKIEAYERCAFVSRGTGQFLPGADAKPTIGQVGNVEFVEEDRVEFVVNDRGDKSTLRCVVDELKKVRPDVLSDDFSCSANFVIIGPPVRRGCCGCIQVGGVVRHCGVSKECA